MIQLDIVTVQHSKNCKKCGTKKVHIRKVNKKFTHFKDLEKYRLGIKNKGFQNVYFCYKELN